MFQDFVPSFGDSRFRPIFSEPLFSSSTKYAYHSYWLPDLLDKNDPFENEYSFEWKSHLMLKNTEEVKKCRESEERFTYYTSSIVRSIFDICKILRQPPEVRYLAVDIFDRFYIKHFFDVAERFEELDNKNATVWQVIVQRIMDQSLLRILSCVQLANKYCSTKNRITPTTIQELITEMGHSYHFSKRSIIKSEARVFQHLNYYIPLRTPLTYLEMFFDEFQKHGFITWNVSLSHFFQICICVLDVAVVYHRQIYTYFLQFINTDDNFEKTSDEYFCVSALKGDSLLLAASVILASSLLLNSDSTKSQLLLKFLCSASECKKYYVHTLAMELIKIVKNKIHCS